MMIKNIQTNRNNVQIVPKFRYFLILIVRDIIRNSVAINIICSKEIISNGVGSLKSPPSNK